MPLLLLLDGVEDLAHAAGGDLDPVAGGDLLVALVVARELLGDRLEAVLGDRQAGRVVEDRGAEHELVVELGLDQDDVHVGEALLPGLDREVQAGVGHQAEGLVADPGHPHVGDAADPRAEHGRDLGS